MKRFALLLVIALPAVAGAIRLQRCSLQPRPGVPETAIQQSSLPALLEIPRSFPPFRIAGLTVSPSDLRFAKALCIPSLPASITSLDHELRLWGVSEYFAEYPESRCSDSRQILEALSDARLAAKVTGYSGRYLQRTAHGLHVARVRQFGETDLLGEPHFGHLMSTFGAVGVPSTDRMITADGEQFTVRDCLTDLCAAYSPDDEPEFFASALAHYLAAPYRWTSASGARQSLSTLADKLLSAPAGEGICFGGHVPFALTMLLRMDQSNECLDADVRNRIRSRLQDVSWQLARSQLATGAWLNWVDRRRPLQYESDLIDRISVTGHHLEWMAFAPPDVRPQPSVIRRAVTGLIEDLHRITPADLRTPATRLPLTHAARAIALLSASDDATVASGAPF